MKFASCIILARKTSKAILKSGKSALNIKANQIDVDVLLSNIKQKYNPSQAELAELIQEKEISLPISIFSKKLGMLEASSLYMRDELGMKFSDIAELLKRDYKTIWTSYSKAKKKIDKR